jgi:hypothetical protein
MIPSSMSLDVLLEYAAKEGLERWIRSNRDFEIPDDEADPYPFDDLRIADIRKMLEHWSTVYDFPTPAYISFCGSGGIELIFHDPDASDFIRLIQLYVTFLHDDPLGDGPWRVVDSRKGLFKIYDLELPRQLSEIAF